MNSEPLQAEASAYSFRHARISELLQAASCAGPKTGLSNFGIRPRFCSKVYVSHDALQDSRSPDALDGTGSRNRSLRPICAMISRRGARSYNRAAEKEYREKTCGQVGSRIS
jgi:hypothetical protein